MSVRITCSACAGGTLVRIEGRLAADGVGELERAMADLTEPRLELSALLSADEAGLAALRVLQARGVPLHGASPYMALLMDSEGPPGGRRRAKGRQGRGFRPQEGTR
jgi:hypothetical protein